MAENIQDAESTIRDTDVAEEMMSYVNSGWSWTGVSGQCWKGQKFFKSP